MDKLGSGSDRERKRWSSTKGKKSKRKRGLGCNAEHIPEQLRNTGIIMGLDDDSIPSSVAKRFKRSPGPNVQRRPEQGEETIIPYPHSRIKSSAPSQFPPLPMDGRGSNGDEEDGPQPGDIAPTPDEVVEDDGGNAGDDCSAEWENEDLEAGEAKEPDAMEIEEIEEGDAGIRLMWTDITGLLLSTGTTRMDMKHYATFRRFMNWNRPASNMSDSVLSVSTVKRLRKKAFTRAVVESEIIMLPVDKTKAGARCGVGRFKSETHAPVQVVKPSSWAKLDLATKQVEDLITDRHSREGNDTRPMFRSIEDTPIVKNRQRALGIYRLPDGGNGFRTLQRGMKVSVRLHCRNEAERVDVSNTFEGIDKDSLELQCTLEDMFVFQGDESGRDNIQSEQPRAPSKKKRKLKRGEPSRTDSLLKPGDAVLRMTWVSNGPGGAEKTIYVSYKMWKKGGDWAITAAVTDCELDCKTNIRSSQAKRFRVNNVICSGEGSDTVQEEDAPSSGFLEDGRRYITYRLLLYCDGFNSQIGKKGSSTGVYMLPLGISPELRAGAGAVRPIALTPPGVSQNDVLRHILDDLVEGSETGFPMKDSEGEEFVVFLDCVGYVADSPAVTSSLDTLGHQANSPCYLCTFGRYDVSGSGGSRYSYSTEIHSGMLCFTRESGRTQALRNAGLTRKELTALGLNATDVIGDNGSMLQQFGLRLSEVANKVPKTDGGKPVVPCLFDCYRSTAVAPDHLVMGLARNLCDTILKLLTPIVRVASEGLIKEVLRCEGLASQESLFNHEKRVLHSMSISAIFAFVLVAPSCFRAALSITGEKETHTDALSVIDLFEKFSLLVAEAYFFPAAEVDGNGTVLEHNEDYGMKHIWNLRRKAVDYLNDLDTTYRNLSKRRDGVEVARILDKPNVHRFLELFTHTIPLFGHVRHIQELLFEGAHQALKRGISRSNGLNAELQAMVHRISNDWKNRIALECKDILDGDGEWTESCVNSVLRLLGWTNISAEYMPTLKEKLLQAFPRPVLEILRETRDQLSGRLDRTLEWEGDGAQYCGPRESVGQVEKLLAFGENEVRNELSTVLGYAFEGEVTSVLHGGARWTLRSSSAGTVARTLVTVSYGDAVQILTRSLAGIGAHQLVWVQGGNVDVQPTMWMFVAAVEFTPVLSPDQYKYIPIQYRRKLCALVKPMYAEGEMYRVNTNDEVRVISTLGSDVRKLLAIHACGNEPCAGGVECEVRMNGSHVYHSKSLEDGGLYYLYGRQKGFPPRSG